MNPPANASAAVVEPKRPGDRPQQRPQSGDGYVIASHVTRNSFIPSIETLKDLPAQMSGIERLVLQTHALACRPERSLEIGVFRGGSAKLLHAAIKGAGGGVLVSVDPDPRHEFDWEAELGDIATLVVGTSPAALPEAVRIAGGPFQFVFIDGDHSERGVTRDLEGLVDATEKGAHLVLHDAAHPPLARGVRLAIESGLPYFDAGMICSYYNEGLLYGTPTRFGGLQLLVRC